MYDEVSYAFFRTEPSFVYRKADGTLRRAKGTLRADLIQVLPFMKKLQFFFSTRFDLRERKGKQKKESFPPNPLLKNKQEKGLEEKTIYIADGDFSGFSSDEKEQPEEEKQTAKVVRLKGHQYLSATLRARQEAFAAELRTYDGIYTREALNDFFNYWAEENKETGEMLWETKKTWNLSKRLKRWVSNMYTNANSAAVIRMNRLKKQQATAASRMPPSSAPLLNLSCRYPTAST